MHVYVPDQVSITVPLSWVLVQLQGPDLTGAVVVWRNDRCEHANNLGLGRLGSLIEKPQHPRNSACLSYTFEQKDRVIVYS